MTTAMKTKTASRRYEGWWSKQISLALGYTVLTLIGLFLFMPIFWLLVNALKVDSEFFTYPVHLFPAVPQWANYTKIFTMTNFLPVASRTAALAISTAMISTFVSAMGGFAFSRYQVKGSKQLFSIVIALMIVPGIVLLIPQFILYARLHLTNTYWPWILGAMGGSSFGIFMFRQFFLGFPKELEEAAEVDGCGPLRMFLQIFLPNAKPVIATSLIFGFNGVWGDYLTPIMYLNNEKTLLPVVITNAFRNPQGYPYQTITLAANVVYILPLIVVFFIAQKQILRGVVTSGLKG